MTTFLYFSYGSNMLTRRLKERCSSAEFLQTIELAGYELKWNKVSNDKSGKCNIIKSPDTNAKVIGVCYEINKNEEANLDSAEGCGYGYKQMKLTIHGQDYMTYDATNTDENYKPYTWYKALVIAGAKENDFPNDYIEQLKKVEATKDPDKERHNENMALIPEKFR